MSEKQKLAQHPPFPPYHPNTQKPAIMEKEPTESSVASFTWAYLLQNSEPKEQQIKVDGNQSTGRKRQEEEEEK